MSYLGFCRETELVEGLYIERGLIILVSSLGFFFFFQLDTA